VRKQAAQAPESATSSASAFSADAIWVAGAMASSLPFTAAIIEADVGCGRLRVTPSPDSCISPNGIGRRGGPARRPAQTRPRLLRYPFPPRLAAVVELAHLEPTPAGRPSSAAVSQASNWPIQAFPSSTLLNSAALFGTDSRGLLPVWAGAATGWRQAPDRRSLSVRKGRKAVWQVDFI